MRNYANLYFIMLCCTIFIVGFFSSLENGFLSIKFIYIGIFWILGITLSMLYIVERNKKFANASDGERRK